MVKQTKKRVRGEAIARKRKRASNSTDTKKTDKTKTTQSTHAKTKPSKMWFIKKDPSKPARFPRLLKAIRWLVVVLIVIAIVPFILTLFYRADSVQPISTLMLGRYATLQPVARDWRPLEEIATSLPQSVLMSEDGKFCSHNGVDWDALNSVIDDALEGEKTRGASTITMQLAKNLFLWPGRSFVRKGLELPLALWIDFIIPKHRIMEIYLNIVELDTGVFGAGSAARVYFKKDVSKLSRKQSALLTVTLPNPKRRNAAKPSKSLRRLARIIERRAKASGAYIKCLKKPQKQPK